MFSPPRPRHVIKMKRQLILENAVENNFTAKQPRAQRIYSKNMNHPFGPFGEAENRSKP
jgi:hypothetical protein